VSIKNAGLLTLVAVLVFGMASAPMLQNLGLAYAASEEDMDDTNDVDEIEVSDSDEADDRDEEFDDDSDDENEDDRYENEDRPSVKDRVKLTVDKFERICELSDSEREEFWAKYDGVTDEQKQMHDRYCAMTVEEKEEFRKN